jgi:N-acetylneuraminic acid mutarotase
MLVQFAIARCGAHSRRHIRCCGYAMLRTGARRFGELVGRINNANRNRRLWRRGSRRQNLCRRRLEFLSTHSAHVSRYGFRNLGSSVNYQYDPATDKWRELAPLPIGLSHVGVVGFNHKLYAFGGFTSLIHANAQNAALVYDPAANAWQWLPPLNSRRGSASAEVVDGKIHVVGGRLRDPTPLDVHEVYDPATNQWTSKASMPLARDHMGVAVIDAKIHIVGGRTGGQTDNVSEHDVYDPTTDKWAKAAPMPTARSGGAAVYYKGLLIYAGGECKQRDPNAKFGGGQDFEEVEGYDPKTDTWRTLARLPSARQAFGAATIGSAAYFPGGTLRCGGLALTDQMLVFR